MPELSERLNKPISTAELERRWAAVRAAMVAQGVDALLMQNNNDHMGGYVKYFPDLPATNGYPNTVVFPRDDLMTMVHQGPLQGDKPIPPEGDGVVRGVKRVLTTPSYASASYTADYDPALACKALEPYARGTIGLVGTYQMSFAMVDYVKRQFPRATFVEASDLVDRIKVIKSDEEIEFIRATAAMQDAAMAAAIAAIRPGMKDSDVAAVAMKVGQELGSEQGVYHCGSFPADRQSYFQMRHSQNRVIREGDVFHLLVENNGPGGFFTELGRTMVLGKASERQKEEFAFTLEAQKFTLGMLKPGTPCGEIWTAYNRFMRENGRPEESRLYCHGQGYDMVERPLVRDDEPWPIAGNMNIVCHPTYVRDGIHSWICDNYVIGGNGPGDSLHRTPQRLFEI